MSSSTDARPNIPSESLAHFSNGVALLLHFWTALKLAVDDQWGGVDSEDKRGWLAGVVVEQFEKNTYPEDIESILILVMTEEFNTLLEDDSAYQVKRKINLLLDILITDPFVHILQLSQDLVNLYQDCVEGYYVTVTMLQERHQRFMNQISTSNKAKIDNDNDSSDGNSNEVSGQDESMYTGRRGISIGKATSAITLMADLHYPNPPVSIIALYKRLQLFILYIYLLCILCIFLLFLQDVPIIIPTPIAGTL
ncbi:hypothetical protein G9A89_003688 [Geosiphon pyriformis]|nr:hypothetical protein G9A89_003688 [Geosiphon pyriformis]